MSSCISKVLSNLNMYSDLKRYMGNRIQAILRLSVSAHLSLVTLQLIFVDLCVFTMMNGSWIEAFGEGTTPWLSFRLFRSTNPLNATCCMIISRNISFFCFIRSRR